MNEAEWMNVVGWLNALKLISPLLQS